MSTDIKGFMNVLTNAKTVWTLIAGLVGCITWIIIQADSISDLEAKLEKEMKHTKEMHDKDVESLNQYIAYNKLLFLSKLPSEIEMAGGTK